MTQGKPKAIVFLTAGLGDNFLTIPLLLELEKKVEFSLMVRRKSEQDFFKTLFPKAEVFLSQGLLSDLTLFLKNFRTRYWIYPIASSTRRYRLLPLLVPGSTAIGFTSLGSEKTWQAELGFKYCILPNLSKKAWQNNMRLLALIFPKELNTVYRWNDCIKVAQTRLSLDPNAEKTPGTLVIHAGSNKYVAGLEKYKRWPISRYFELVKTLSEKQVFNSFEWLIGPGEEDLQAEIDQFVKAHPQSKIVDCQKAFGGDLVSLLHFIHQKEYYLGNDSGIAHLASLANIPMTAFISGISQVEYTGHNGDHVQLIWEDVPCRGCAMGISPSLAESFFCPHSWGCMENISADRVFQTLNKHVRSLNR